MNVINDGGLGRITVETIGGGLLRFVLLLNFVGFVEKDPARVTHGQPTT